MGNKKTPQAQAVIADHENNAEKKAVRCQLNLSLYVCAQELLPYLNSRVSND